MSEKLIEEIEVAEKPVKKVSKKSSKKSEAVETVAEVKPAKKAAAKKTATKKAEVSSDSVVEETAKPAKKVAKKPAAKKVKEPDITVEIIEEAAPVTEEVSPVIEEVIEDSVPVAVGPRRSVVFIGSECYPFVKTGGLGDVMYALPKVLVQQNCDVKVIIPNYKCIPAKFKEKMVFKGSFEMDLCSDGRKFYVGIMEYIEDGVVYDFIDNEEFFSNGNPYTTIVDDIPKFCFFSKASLAALNYMDWVPDVVHCHDWQAALIPIYIKTLFANTNVGRAKSILTIHNLRFQGIYNTATLKYWSGLPDDTFTIDVLKQGVDDANMMKGGLAYADIITTVSNTYAGEIQTDFYGENLDAHLRHHSSKLVGIVNGIDYDIWNTATDSRLPANYDISDVIEKKAENKAILQEKLGMYKDGSKFVLGLISRLTDQKGLDLVNAIIPQVMDEHTQLVVLGTGDPVYEDAFRYYENEYKGNVCSSIMYDETRAHEIYAGADALLVPSQFEPCGLTQLIGMHFGTVPVVRETGGLKDTVDPYNQYEDSGNGFTFDRYEAELLLDTINRAKDLFFNNRASWDEMVKRNMLKDVSWENSAKQYKDLYLGLTPRFE